MSDGELERKIYGYIEPPEEGCLTCRFFASPIINNAALGAGDGAIYVARGQCRRFPPVANRRATLAQYSLKEAVEIELLKRPDVAVFRWHFPEVLHHEWCGEFKLSEGKFGENLNYIAAQITSAEGPDPWGGTEDAQ